MSSRCKAYLTAVAGTLTVVLCVTAVAQQSADLIAPEQTESAPVSQK